MRARAQVPVKEKHGGKLAQSTPRGQLPSSDAWEVRAFVDENNRKVWSRELDPDASILKLPPNQARLRYLMRRPVLPRTCFSRVNHGSN